MITDLDQIRRDGEAKREENERFRKFLKRHNFQEKKFRILAQNVEEQTDCLTCANCCRVATVRLTERDVERLSKFLRLKPSQVLRDYCQDSQDEGLILKRDEKSGCIFLNGTECIVYEARPDNCSAFPHLVRGAGSVLARFWDFKDRATYCPIVYNTLEGFKKEVNFPG